MTKKITLLLFFITIIGYAQQIDSINYKSHFTTAEFQLGFTQSANRGFPETKLQKSLSLHFGKYQNKNNQEWAYRLRYPKTGLSFAITDYGNKEFIGYSASVMPFIEFGVLKKIIKNLNMNIGFGASYFTKSYNGYIFSINNPINNNNRAISTKVTWSIKSFLYYDIIKNKQANWRIGAGFIHHSNGHTKLPNQGLNSFAFSVARQASYNFNNNKKLKNENPEPIINYEKSLQYYFTIRSGAGLNFLSESFNDRKGVYTLAPSFGIILNKTFKIGIGFYYRFYEHYNNYIENTESSMLEEYAYFKENSFKYSSSIGAFISFELLLGHVGLEVDLGYNIYKPFYELDWKLNGFYWDFENEDGTIETTFIERDITKEYYLKHAILARAGLKYYLFNNDKNPKSNFFIAMNINANFGQADFSELSLGYVHRFGFKSRKLSR